MIRNPLIIGEISAIFSYGNIDFAKEWTQVHSFLYDLSESETMSARETIEKKAESLVAPIVEANGFELWDVEYVKEGKEKYLRAYIDKPGGITIDDCEIVSRAFSDKLDEDDFIGEAYILEVSSPGLTRPLKKDRDFEKSIGRLVECGTFSKINGSKEFCGKLLSFDGTNVVVEQDEEEITIERKQLSYIRLAFEF